MLMMIVGNFILLLLYLGQLVFTKMWLAGTYLQQKESLPLEKHELHQASEARLFAE